MQYYTRLFHDTRVPYYLLDEFKVYEEAERYSEEFYQRLLAEREEELAKLSWVEETHAFSGENVAEQVEMWKKLPVRHEIADARIFFLRGIAPSVMKLIEEKQQEQDAEWAALRKRIEERQSLDKTRMPVHWLPLLEAEWFDGFVEWTTEGERVLSAVVHFTDRRICKIKFHNARIWKEAEEERGTINLFAEVLWEDGKLRLNILTHTNEFSVLAEDVELEWSEEDFACMRKRERGEIE